MKTRLRIRPASVGHDNSTMPSKITVALRALLFLVACLVILIVAGPLTKTVSPLRGQLLVGMVTSLFTFALTFVFVRWDGLQLRDVGAAVSAHTVPQLFLRVCDRIGACRVANHGCLRRRAYALGGRSSSILGRHTPRARRLFCSRSPGRVSLPRLPPPPSRECMGRLGSSLSDRSGLHPGTRSRRMELVAFSTGSTGGGASVRYGGSGDTRYCRSSGHSHCLQFRPVVYGSEGDCRRLEASRRCRLRPSGGYPGLRRLLGRHACRHGGLLDMA